MSAGTTRRPTFFPADPQAPVFVDGAISVKTLDGQMDLGTPLPPVAERDESLVADVRAALSPAQMVERKLLTMLKGKPLPVSHVRMAGLLQNRGRSANVREQRG